MVITEIVLMKNSFKCSNYVKKKKSKGGKRNLITVVPWLKVSTNLVLKKPSVIVIKKEILFV